MVVRKYENHERKWRDMRFLFLHGLGSGAKSRMAEKLEKSFPDAEIVHPEQPTPPAAFVFDD